MHYFFHPPEEFEAMEAGGHFLESAHVYGKRYGTPRAPVEAALAEGRDVLFDVDWGSWPAALVVLLTFSAVAAAAAMVIGAAVDNEGAAAGITAESVSAHPTDAPTAAISAVRASCPASGSRGFWHATMRFLSAGPRRT